MSDPSIDERVIRARGPDYLRLVEQRREQERVRKRDERRINRLVGELERPIVVAERELCTPAPTPPGSYSHRA